ncbi:MAG TPA: response regulator [Acidimicrobiales bacterium]|nr:response regulator [Acidimicrobiales bacterium]
MPLVLVVDDEPNIRQLVKTGLEMHGFEAVVAAGGREALAAIEEHHPDVVILDVMMPEMDGWEVLSRIKSLEGVASETPVLMLTARSADLDRIRGGIEGAIRYMTKPFELDDLVKEVHDAIGGDPEPARRKRSQQHALEDLARLERGDQPGSPVSTAPRPHLTRLERPHQPEPAPRPAPGVSATRLGMLSLKQRELLDAVAATPTVTEAAERLEVSRSNVYASLRRIARKLDVHSVEDLVRLARSGGVARPA